MSMQSPPYLIFSTDMHKSSGLPHTDQPENVFTDDEE